MERFDRVVLYSKTIVYNCFYIFIVDIFFNITNTSSANELGPITDISTSAFNEFTISIDFPGSTAPTIPNNSFFMFSKDNNVNLASVLGYHAEVQFVNNSNKKAEMFSVGSIVQLNSK